MSIADKLRSVEKSDWCLMDSMSIAVTGESAKCMDSCEECRVTWMHKLADAIEAEAGGLPDGVIWPRFEDGQLVKFGDRLVGYHAKSDQMHEDTVSSIHLKRSGYKINGTVNRHTYAYGEPVKRPRPEVFDAEGVPINVGDTVYYVKPTAHTEGERIVDAIVGREVQLTNGYWTDPANLTHRKPDSTEAIRDDATMPSGAYCARCGLVESGEDVDDATLVERHILHLLERQRKLMGADHDGR